MQCLYPEIRTNKSYSLQVDDTHTLYIEESGDPQGIPVLFIHGGPGAGTSSFDRRFFDPDKYRIILFDQRGAGQSKPHASLNDNTTGHLIADIEKIREHLKVDKWLLFGGSWGSTLALLYAQAYPERVQGMILRGIFLCRDKDLEWFYQSGADRIFPDYWEDYLSPIPDTERTEMISAYYRRLTGANELAKMGAAKAWAQWEGRCATLRPNPDVVHQFSEPHMAVSLARIEAHYFVNKAFIEPDQIIRDADKLANIPGIIIHGRYDMVCPLDGATTLHNAWPSAELHIIRDAGHSSHEPSICDALVKATNDMAEQLSGEGDLQG
ncbi:prolyl aminopeptidase [Marinagarivorans cellulosilyticus]|uniref:Proline iminopeptidase n=1 Tax=Marinagarivorans cellulosilyticus TaxID=2721545 RepID=A0AAN2BJI4_9GAMM|nr:prolyl aminopeptidase [Marinagarivorans cellulosilyticus]BCD96979.1 proline iminopeptidase [Marinagarivorans cellulosilyticus]